MTHSAAWVLLVVLIAASKPAGPAANAATSTSTSPPTSTSTPAAPKPAKVAPKRFASPEAAVQAFVDALRSGNAQTLVALLGSDGRALVSSGDQVADRNARARFLDAYDRAHTLAIDGATAVVRVGDEGWPFPIPVVKDGDRWRFDVRRGREEILARRIGRNEIFAMQTCLAYVDAQREYYAEDRNGQGILEYAQKFDSTPGRRDGLYWPTAADERSSPLGPLVVRAHAEGYRRQGSGPTPYHGYVYRILTAQGPDAPGGEYDYVSRGHMIAGFALVAFPAEYGASGVMTFLVNHDGIIFQKDLGPDTRRLALGMRSFNPDLTWTSPRIPDLSADSLSASPPSR